MRNTLFMLAVLLALAGCKEEFKESDELNAIITTETPAEAAESAPVMMDRMAPLGEGNDASRQEAFTQKVIKNAVLRFETDDLAATASTVTKLIGKYGAQVQSDSESSQGYELNRTMEVRVPSNRFEAFITAIGTGVKYFDVKQISSEDITERYIDTDARIKAEKVLESRYLELIGKAQKVSEILEIEKELSAIREEIESKEGQLRYMKSRVAMSTVRIEFYKRLAERPDATVSYGSKIWNAIVSGFNGISSFLIVLLNIWPLILIFVIGFILIRRKLKKRRKNHV